VNSFSKSICFLFSFLLVSTPAFSQIQTQPVDYQDGDTVLEGYLAYDDQYANELRPGILVVHQWKGLDDYTKRRARELAELGYVAFAVDIYGKGVRAANREEARQLAGLYKHNLPLLRRRAHAGLEALKHNPTVDVNRIGAIGYCFGGTTVLEMARAGEPIDAIVSFHGGLDTAMPAQPGEVKAKLLVLHGADDPSNPPALVQQFKDEMNSAGTIYQFIAYSGAVHAFTDPSVGNDPSKGVAYNEAADKASWLEMKKFFKTVFGS